MPWAAKSVVAAAEGKVIFSNGNWIRLHFLQVLVWFARLTRMHDMVVVRFLNVSMDSFIIRDCPKAGLLALLLKMSDESYVKSTYVTYIMVIYYSFPSQPKHVN
jgi:hypothetical protein